MAELLRNPNAMAKAQSELTETIGRRKEVRESDIAQLPYLQAIIKETLRLHPPGPLMLPHKALSNVEIGGFTIQKDSQVLVNVWAIGRDPQTWENRLGSCLRGLCALTMITEAMVLSSSHLVRVEGFVLVCCWPCAWFTLCWPHFCIHLLGSFPMEWHHRT